MTYIEGVGSGYDRDGGFNDVDDPIITKRLLKGLHTLTDKHLVDVVDTMFQREQSLQAVERGERRYDHHVYDGLMLVDDELANINPRYADLRTNLIRKPVMYLISLLHSMEVGGRVYPAAGGFDNNDFRMMVSDYDKRLKSVLHFARYRAAMIRAIRDAAVVGEGFVHDGVRLSEYDPTKLEFFIQHVDWRNLWVDSKSEMGDLSDADHIFCLRKMSLHEAQFRWPSKAEELQRMSFEDSLGSPMDERLDGDGSIFSPTITSRRAKGPQFDIRFEMEQQSYMNRRGGGGPVNYLVQSYIRTYDSETGMKKLNRSIMCYDESLTKPMLVNKITQPYQHHMIPFSRISFAQYGENKQPYSPLTRNKRGFEKMMTWLLRSAVRFGTSRGIIYDPNRIIDPGMSPEKVLAEYRRELASPSPILRTYGGFDSFKLERLEADLEKILAVLTTVKQMNDEQSGISPELMGKEAPNMPGVTFDAKRDETMRNFPEVVESLENAVQGMCERILSNIEQFSPLIAYGGVVGPAGDISPMDYDGDASIKGNRMRYFVEPQPVSKSIMRDQLNVLAAAVQKIGDPKAMIALLPALARLGGGPDSVKLERLFVEFAQIMGVPVPKSLLTEEEAAMADQQAQAEQAKQAKVEQIQEEDALANIDKTKGQAFQAVATGIAALTKDEGQAGAGEEVEALREEIARHQREWEDEQS